MEGRGRGRDEKDSAFYNYNVPPFSLPLGITTRFGFPGLRYFG